MTGVWNPVVIKLLRIITQESRRMTLQQLCALTLEQLARELPESRFGRGIDIRRTNDEISRSATLAGLWDLAKCECKDSERLAHAEGLMWGQTAYLFALWNYSFVRSH
jgi:hypothetical protein